MYIHVFISCRKFPPVQTVFSAFSSFSCWVSYESHVVHMRIPQQVFLHSDHFFFIPFPFCFSVWIISMFLSSNLLTYSSAHSNLLLNPSSEFVILVIILISSRTCWVLFYNSYLLRFGFCSHSAFLISSSHSLPWFALAR